MVLVHEKECKSVWFPPHYTFHGMAVICLCAKHNNICRFLLCPIHYYVSHGMPVEASDCSASILRDFVTHLGPLSTFCDLLLWFIGQCVSELSNKY